MTCCLIYTEHSNAKSRFTFYFPYNKEGKSDLSDLNRHTVQTIYFILSTECVTSFKATTGVCCLCYCVAELT